MKTILGSIVAVMIFSFCTPVKAAEFHTLNSFLTYGGIGPSDICQTEIYYLVIPDDGDTLVDIALQLEQHHNQGSVSWRYFLDENPSAIDPDTDGFDILWSFDWLKITLYTYPFSC
ncbi:hypothetical protein HQ571_05980 [Candidatus Kuenenbacteria bacterium]|nr:hypothetical protein [Candidatus Kuenenbacteria bacterium]